MSWPVANIQVAGLEATEVEALYGRLQPQLVRILASNLQPPDWVVDDACQSAWSSLLSRRDTVAPGSELGWLSTTATREALRLMRRERVVDPEHRPAEVIDLADHRTAPGPEQVLELRQRLAEIRRLPVRQQRLVMLHGLGYEYEEIAAVTGATRRTVHRQLVRARQRLRLLAEEG